jgi:release factor glutamine methyltransferase
VTIDDALAYAKSKIHSDHAKLLLADLLGINPLELLLHLDDEVDEEKLDLYKREVDAMRDNKPLQYVIGHVNFYGNKFFIDENVLIPRYETEELVEKTINKAKELFTEPVDIIDIGCGSGVIGLTLEKKLSTKSVDLIDISKEALEVCHKNCGNLNSKANLIQSDVFENVDKKYDIIISNPPYIRDDEEIEDIVKENEPHIALFAGTDGLDVYRKIFDNIKEHMKEKCLIALEIGSEQADSLKDLISKKIDNVEIEVIKDLQDRDRVMLIYTK